ncbi:Protein of unknown function [Bacillus wiedmannii]|nr:Protein of unknown function [Bacillus wiedmannii]
MIAHGNSADGIAKFQSGDI